jgi:hypothetical protein
MELHSGSNVLRIELAEKEKEIANIKRIIDGTPFGTHRTKLCRVLDRLRKEKTEIYKNLTTAERVKNPIAK